MFKDQNHSYSKETLIHLLSKVKSIQEYPDISFYFSKTQNEKIKPQDRNEILLWLLHVNDRVGGTANSIQYCIRYFDTFLSLKSVSHVKVLRLVGIVALNIAFKYEHIKELTPKQLYEICQKAFPIEAIIQTELFVLNTLAWKLDVPTASEIIRHLMACTCGDFDCSCIIENADSFAALCYLDTNLAFKKPFLLALASICCALDKFRVCEFKAEWLKIVGKEFPFDLQALETTLEQIQVKVNDMIISNEHESTEAGSSL